jgi:large subunit ribosomal protein L10
MTREEKTRLIDVISDQLSKSNNIYITDISDLNAEVSNKLRALCFKRQVTLQVVKNTLLKKAMEKSGKDFSPLFVTLKGNTSIMISESGNVPAKLIKEFRRTSERPILKGAYIEDTTYVGDDLLDALINIKTKNELVADLILLLQSPMRNVVSALQSGNNVLTGVLKTLAEKN